MLVARRNLSRDRLRLALSVAGVALSVALILLLAGYREGVYAQAAAYLDHAPGSIVVAERGVANFLGASSTVPASLDARVRAIDGVRSVAPVITQFVVFEEHDRKDGFFLVGYEPTTGGGPWSLVGGREPAADDELVMDATSARQHGLAVGDSVRVLDRPLRLVGLSRDTTFWAGSLAFARIGALESLLRAADLRSFLLVEPAPGRAEDVTRAIGQLGVAATPVDTVIANDQRLLARVYDAPVGLMVVIAFVVGVLVVGLVVYTATVERRREYGVLKAIGARNRTFAGVVAAQALIATSLGTGAGVALAWFGSAALMVWRPQFVVRLELEAAVIVGAASIVMALLAALAPARSLGRLDPASVLRG